MTQKEYQEKLEKILKEKADLSLKIEELENKLITYQDVLEGYYVAQSELKREREFNNQNLITIREQEKIIERYEKILDKFTINC